MTLRRKLNDYRCQLENGQASPFSIPYSTLRCWRMQGKISDIQLLEMGISPKRRKRRAPQQQLPALNQDNQPGVSSIITEVLPSESNDAPHLNDCTSSSRSIPSVNVNDQLNDDEDISQLSDDEESSSTTGSSDDSSIAALSDSDISSDDSSHEDDILLHNRINSVLRSKKIGIEAFNQPLSDNLTITKFETMLMIFHLALRHNLTDVFLEDMMSFVNELLSDPNAIPGSKFLFHKLFMFGSKPVVHFFCPECDKYLGPKGCFQQTHVLCDTCDWSQTVSGLNDNNYFVTLNMKDQLSTVLNRPNLKLVSREDTIDRVVSDMIHGQIYKNLMKESGVLSNKDALSISISTDGSPVFRNGSYTLYPLHFHLNKIHPEDRFDVENILLGGLWFSKKGERNLQICLKPIVDEILSMEKMGVTWRKPDGCVVESPIYLTCVCADSVARCKIQNVIQFNGAYGCSYCLHPNTSLTHSEQIDSRSGIHVQQPNDGSEDEYETNVPQRVVRERKVLRYLSNEEHPYRTDKGLRHHMKLASESHQEHIFGAKGLSVLIPITSLDMVFGVPIDYFHAILLGVMKKLVTLWFDRSSSGKVYYIGLQVETVNKRLEQISVPSNMARPRPMSDRVHWIGKEWRGFLLHYGLPCLLEILPEPYYGHFKKLVTAIFILTKESIGYDEGEEADVLLQEFVSEYQNLYGEINMVYIVHLTSHLGRQVAKLGPLWAYNLFHFETANGRLVKLMKGTKGVALQIARKYLMTHTIIKLLRSEYTVRSSVLDFCGHVVGFRYSKNSSKCGDTTLVGRPQLVSLSEDQSNAFHKNGFNFTSEFATVYNRAFLKNNCFSSRKFGRQKSCNDSCVRLVDGSFVVIDLIVQINDNDIVLDFVWCIGTEINVATNISYFMAPHLKECAIDPFGSVKAFPFSNIRSKCIPISYDDKYFVSEFPNTFEKS